MKQNSTNNIKGEYVLATGRAAAHRLQILHSLYGPGARRVLLQAGLQPGMRVADLGCGVGMVTTLLAELEIGGFLDGGLKMQTQFDLEAFERATGRTLTETERQQFMTIQLQANRWTYLGSGMSHPNFLATVEKLQPKARRRLEEEIAPGFC